MSHSDLDIDRQNAEEERQSTMTEQLPPIGFITWVRTPGQAWEALGWSEEEDDARAAVFEHLRYCNAAGIPQEAQHRASNDGPPVDQEETPR